MYRVAAVALAILLGGCAGVIHNDPRNVPLVGGAAVEMGRDTVALSDDLLIGLAFSGGGTRAAAFSFGMLRELDRVRIGNTSILDRVDIVSGVSGGSVTAAYFGLKKRAALDDFRERFLLQNAEADIRTKIDLTNLSRALAGGVNDENNFPRWLDANLFNGATFHEFRAERRPRIWINASDIYNRTPFVFGATAFRALCSDISQYRIADAVAASAAVPIIFAPVVIEAYPQSCTARLPDWAQRALADENAPPQLRAFAQAIARYSDGSMRYVKLLDGGLVDNFGISGFTIARLSSDTPYGPMTPQQAVRLRRSIFIVADAGLGPSGNWTQTIAGPDGPELVNAAADTAMVASVRASFTAFESTLNDWQSALVRWRCGLSAAERARFGVPANWNCRDLKFYVARVAFDQLGKARAAELNSIPTRFRLPEPEVDALISAGGEALRIHPTYREFLGSLRLPVRGPEVANAAPAR
jgi:NTE family protein